MDIKAVNEKFHSLSTALDPAVNMIVDARKDAIVKSLTDLAKIDDRSAFLTSLTAVSNAAQERTQRGLDLMQTTFHARFENLMDGKHPAIQEFLGVVKSSFKFSSLDCGVCLWAALGAGDAA